MVNQEEKRPHRKPDWLKIKFPKGKAYRQVKEIVEQHKLHTICQSGLCPNMAECWGNGTATFMILGEICTRSCKFCATRTGKPLPVNYNEPLQIAESVKLMKLHHVVITSVDRDDLEDYGAALWAETVTAVKRINPDTTIEILIPDFCGNDRLIVHVCDSRPDVISHNLETVERLTPLVRSKADYHTSLHVLSVIARYGLRPKSGIMLGLGERHDEILQTMDNLLAVGCEVLTLGQYLQPTKDHLPVERYVTPRQFDEYRQIALEKGFLFVESAPLVRSSYHAEKHV
jgi:lipoic acid synthetase